MTPAEIAYEGGTIYRIEMMMRLEVHACHPVPDKGKWCSAGGEERQVWFVCGWQVKLCETPIESDMVIATALIPLLPR